METIRLCGVDVHPVSLDQAADQVLGWAGDRKEGRVRLVVTPNVDHVVMFAERADVREVYGAADLVLVDGKPLVWVARLQGRPLPGRVAGSDLVPQVFARSRQTGQQVRAYFLGAGSGVGERAAKRVEQDYPTVKVVGVFSPPRGFEKDPQQNEGILERIRAAEPDLLLVGLGAPKQELWVQAHREAIHAKVALCIGATIDFLAGEKSRAPEWMQKVGAEWLYRVLQEPRRLGPRYARDGVVFPKILLGELLQARRRPSY